MYQPKKYKKNTPEFFRSFITAHPFATVVLQGNRMLATHVPVLLDRSTADLRLFAHIANHNPMKRFLKSGKDMLAIFKGADAYVSSSWYSQPEIPTWDYEAVHINARIEIQSEEELQDSLDILLGVFEAPQECPVGRKDIPEDIWSKNFKEITGFWLYPTHISGIAKLHQGFEKGDLMNVSRNLYRSKNEQDREIARRIEEENKGLL